MMLGQQRRIPMGNQSGMVQDSRRITKGNFNPRFNKVGGPFQRGASCFRQQSNFRGDFNQRPMSNLPFKRNPLIETTMNTGGFQGPPRFNKNRPGTRQNFGKIQKRFEEPMELCENIGTEMEQEAQEDTTNEKEVDENTLEEYRNVDLDALAETLDMTDPNQLKYFEDVAELVQKAQNQKGSNKENRASNQQNTRHSKRQEDFEEIQMQSSKGNIWSFKGGVDGTG